MEDLLALLQGVVIPTEQEIVAVSDQVGWPATRRLEGRWGVAAARVPERSVGLV